MARHASGLPMASIMTCIAIGTALPVVLFSHASDPALCAPRTPLGDSVAVLRRPDLAGLMPDEVLASLPATI
jgi:hypothetical protein